MTDDKRRELNRQRQAAYRARQRDADRERARIQGAPEGWDARRGDPVIFDPAPWKQHGLCIGTSVEIWFPERGDETRQQKALCAGCPVKWQCLRYSLDGLDRHGIWGGTSERDRRAIRAGRHRLSPDVIRLNARAEARYLPEDVWQAKEGA